LHFFYLFALFFCFFGKTRLCDKDFILAAQEAEAANPLSLAELFRLSLCFVDEELAEDPQPGTPLQMPHLKGLAIEEMLITVYRRYCRYSRSLQFNTIQNNIIQFTSSKNSKSGGFFIFTKFSLFFSMPKSSAAGFMSIEQFIEFFEDSAILHVSRVVWTDVF
jgi:hypothetical protein